MFKAKCVYVVSKILKRGIIDQLINFKNRKLLRKNIRFDLKEEWQIEILLHTTIVQLKTIRVSSENVYRWISNFAHWRKINEKQKQ